MRAVRLRPVYFLVMTSILLALLLSACSMPTPTVLIPPTATLPLPTATVPLATPTVQQTMNPVPTVTPIATTVKTAQPAPVTTSAQTTPATTTAAVTTTTPNSSSLPWQSWQPGYKVSRPSLAGQEKAMLDQFQSDISLVDGYKAPVYNLALKVDATLSSASGSEQLFYTNDTGQTLDSIYLWLWANAPTEPGYNEPWSVSNVRLNGAKANYSTTNGGAQLKIELNKLTPGDTVVVELDYRLAIPVAGDYEYFKYDAASQILSLTYAYPQVALYSDGWDTHPYNEQGDISNSRISFFNMWLTLPADQVAVINGKTLQTNQNPDGSKTYRVATGPVRDLVAVASPRFKSYNAKAGATNVSGYFLEKDRAAGEQGVEIAAKALQVYSQLFGNYPYNEFKIVEAPLVNFGGFEYPAMIIITNRYYTDGMYTSLEYAVAHEIAHQWWYGLVGSDQIYHAWQDESLAQFTPIWYYEKYKSKTEAQRILAAYLQNGFRAMVTTGHDDIVDQPNYVWKDFTAYLWAVYNKGGLFYQAYRTTFGDQALISFTRNYYEANRYKFARENDILEALKAGAGPGQEETVLELYRHWIKAREGDKDQ